MIFFYTIRTKSFAFWMDKLLNQIESAENIADKPNSETPITYTYSILTIKLYWVIKLWEIYKNEELVITRKGKKLILRGFLARYAVKKHIDADSLLTKYSPDLEGKDEVVVSGPRRILLNVFKVLAWSGIILAIPALLIILDTRWHYQFVQHLTSLSISLSLVVPLKLYSDYYYRKLNQLLGI